jgi:hypothetical protein
VVRTDLKANSRMSSATPKIIASERRENGGAGEEVSP